MAERLDKYQIEDLKARADLAAIVGRATTLRCRRGEMRGPCPFCGGDGASERFQVKGQFWQCWACNKRGDVIKFLMEHDRLTWAETIETLGGHRELGPADHRRLDQARAREEQRVQEWMLTELERARAIWHGAAAAAGSAVETYLRTRGIVLPPPPTLRCAVDLPFWWSSKVKGARPQEIYRGPAMVAPIQGPDGKLIGVHMTWLAVDGIGKARIVSPEGDVCPVKKIRGKHLGGAIRLGPAAPVLVIGEGIETTLSVIQSLTDDGVPRWRSCVATGWAGIALGNIAGKGLGRSRKHRERDVMVPPAEPDPNGHALMPPEWAETIVLLGDGDSDPDVTGAQIERAARRWAQAGFDVAVVWAEQGKDFNDMLRERDAA